MRQNNIHPGVNLCRAYSRDSSKECVLKMGGCRLQYAPLARSLIRLALHRRFLQGLLGRQAGGILLIALSSEMLRDSRCLQRLSKPRYLHNSHPAQQLTGAGTSQRMPHASDFLCRRHKINCRCGSEQVNSREHLRISNVSQVAKKV